MAKGFSIWLNRFSLSSIKTAWKSLFNLDYELTVSMIPAYGIVSSIVYWVFHFAEKSMGYRDSIPIRIIAFILSLLTLVWPKAWEKHPLRILSWEITLLFILPFAQVYLFLLNPSDSYWQSSNVFWALFLGLGTKSVWLGVHMVLGQYLAYWIFRHTQGSLPPEKIHDLLEQQVTLWTSAAGGVALKIALEVFHRRGLALAGVTARAEDAEAHTAKINAALTELKRREEVIRRFIRPSLFEEMAAGKNPVDFRPVQCDMAVLFCDIRDFTRLTEKLTSDARLDFLNEYFSLMTQPIRKHGGEVDKIMGDCVMGLFPDGRSAVLAAVEMRLHLQEFNRGMIAAGTPKICNGIGIAKGEVILGNFGSFEKLDRTVIGESVNIASRLESKTKMYNLEIVVTEAVVEDLDPADSHYRWIDSVQVKGSTRHLKLYEIYGHQPEEVRKYKDATRAMLEKALTIYFQKGFNDASRIFKAMLENVPPHRHNSHALMDNLIRYYLDHCEAWIKDSTSWEAIEKWDRVHIFYEK